jgi:hypothetical protein
MTLSCIIFLVHILTTPLFVCLVVHVGPTSVHITSANLRYAPHSVFFWAIVRAIKELSSLMFPWAEFTSPMTLFLVRRCFLSNH